MTYLEVLVPVAVHTLVSGHAEDEYLRGRGMIGVNRGDAGKGLAISHSLTRSLLHSPTHSLPQSPTFTHFL